MKKFICKIFGHTHDENLMRMIVILALSKLTSSIKCKRCGVEMNPNLKGK